MDSQEQGRKLFQQLMEVWIGPHIERRRQEQSPEAPFQLTGAQIIFYSDRRPPAVRLNEEVKALGDFKLKPGVTKGHGDPLFEHEVEGLENIRLTDGEDPDCGHVTLILVRGTWTIAYDARYNKALSKQHLDTAREFLATARFARGSEYWASFVDNLFSACELAAKARLLSMPDADFREKANHRAIKTRYNQFAQLGNALPSQRKAFNNLSKLREKARYLKGAITISSERADELLTIVTELIETEVPADYYLGVKEPNKTIQRARNKDARR